MKQPKLGEGWKFRDMMPENKKEIIQLFISEVKEFRRWANTVSKERKESIFWECDYDQQLYLDIVIELIFERIKSLQDLPSKVIEEILFVIARNHEQGNILSWKNPDKEISYLKMDKVQFRFLSSEIIKRGENNAKFQIAIVYRKLNSITAKDREILTQLACDEDPFVKNQGMITLELFSKNKN